MTLRRALLVLAVPAFASLGGCELIVGVRDINANDGGGDADDDSVTVPGVDSGDAPVSLNDGPGTSQDGTQPDSGLGRDAIANTDATGEDAPTGAEPGAEASMTADAQQSDAGKQDAPSEGSATEASAPAFELIDDMEANSGQVALTNGRNGFWFTYGDGTDGGVETPGSGLPFTDSMNSPPRVVPASFVSFTGAESNYAAQTSGSGFAMFAGMGVNFKNPRVAYNASAYSGFVFWGRIGGDSSVSVVRFLVPDANTDPAGGICTPASKCSDYLGTDITLSTSWQQFTVLYTDLAQVGFGSPVETNLDAMAVYGVEFQVSTKAPAGEPFDIWIDDLYFIKP
jgi:hypothetical protein